MALRDVVGPVPAVPGWVSRYLARRFFRDAADAADAVQDAFLAAFRFIGGFEATASLSTWLHRIAVDCCLLELRSGRRKPFVSLAVPELAAARSEADPLDARETRDLVRRCIDGLPPAWKQVIRLRDLDGLDTATAARVLGTSEAVVETRLHRARHALKRSLESAHFELKPARMFQGVPQHLEHTSGVQRDGLKKSRGELPASKDTVAVVVPIRKTAAWWALPQDERMAHFNERDDEAGHTAIGADYVDRVYRELYHTRYSVESTDHDFIACFEFDRADTGAFQKLLARLRDPAKNPEWTFVDREYEVWMTKLE